MAVHHAPVPPSAPVEHVRSVDRFANTARPTLVPQTRRAPALRDPVGRSGTLEAHHKVWTTTYWPMSGFAKNGEVPDGEPNSHLWAKGGVLEKVDRVLAARGQPTGARDFELQPYFNYLVGKPTGYYIPAGVVLERDFERTSGVDIDGDGVLRPNIKFDFVDSEGNYRKDGRTDGELSVYWFGSCDRVAVAGMKFREPQRPVTIEGVTFTPQDVRGLLSLAAIGDEQKDEMVGIRFRGEPDRVEVEDGTVYRGRIDGLQPKDILSSPGTFSYHRDMLVEEGGRRDVDLIGPAGKTMHIPKAFVRSIATEVTTEPSPAVFHETVRKWLGEKRPFALDLDPDVPVWNYAFDTAIFDVQKFSDRPETLIGHDGPAGDGEISRVRTTLSGSRFAAFDYWLEVKDSRVVNSGWLSKPVDFLWRENSQVDKSGRISRNPHLPLELVDEIYRRSL